MVDSMLGGLFGGPDGDRVRSKAQDFVSKYEQGGDQNVSNGEVLDQFKTAMAQASPEDRRAAIDNAMENMSPEQRRAFRQAMREQRGANRHFQAGDHDDAATTARETHSFINEATSQPSEGGIGGFLGNLFGGGGHDTSAAASVPTPAPAPAPNAQASTGSDIGGMLDNPAVKAAMAGMAAFAMKKVLENYQQNH